MFPDFYVDFFERSVSASSFPGIPVFLGVNLMMIWMFLAVVANWIISGVVFLVPSLLFKFSSAVIALIESVHIMKCVLAVVTCCYHSFIHWDFQQTENNKK